MSSGGTGSEITADDANDLLHKLITESTKVQVAFVSTGGISLFMQGALKAHSDGKVCVAAGWEFSSPQFIFDPRLAVSRKYADKRVFPAPSRRLEEAGAPSVESGLCFVFGDDSQLLLFEIGEP